MNEQPKQPRPRPPMPLESFGPNLLAALLVGAVDGFEVWATYKECVRFRLRVHRLRAAMRAAKHPKYSLVARVKVTIRWPDGTPTEKSGRYIVPIDRNTKCKLALRPNDSEFDDMLKGVGIDPLMGIGSDPGEGPADGALPTKSLEDLLNDLMPPDSSEKV